MQPGPNHTVCAFLLSSTTERVRSGHYRPELQESISQSVLLSVTAFFLEKGGEKPHLLSGWKNSFYFIINRIIKYAGMDLSFGNQRLDIFFNLIFPNSHSLGEVGDRKGPSFQNS